MLCCRQVCDYQPERVMGSFASVAFDAPSSFDANAFITVVNKEPFFGCILTAEVVLRNSLFLQYRDVHASKAEISAWIFSAVNDSFRKKVFFNEKLRLVGGDFFSRLVTCKKFA